MDDPSVMSSYYFMHFMKTTILCLTSRLSESLSRNWWVQNYIVFCFFISPLFINKIVSLGCDNIYFPDKWKLSCLLHCFGTKFPETPVSLERNTEVFRHPLL